MKTRTVVGVVLGAVFVLVVNCLPAPGGWLVLVVISAAAQLEFYELANRAGLPVFKVLGVLCGTALISGTFWTIGRDAAATSAAYSLENVALLAALLVVFVRQFPQRNNPVPLGTIACTLMGIFYVPFLFNYVARLACAWGGAGVSERLTLTGRLLVFYLVVVVKSADIAAYFGGMLLGRRKLFPRISPAKTWEGLAAGFVGGLAASWLFATATGFRVGELAFRRADTVALGVLLTLAGVLGDMFESLIKRAAGAKDSGRVLPGIGGILDLIDSVLFGAPVLYAYLHLTGLAG